MAKIHGLIYILIGAFISIMSWRLNYEKLLFFFYAGLIFVFIGIVKLVFNWIKNKVEKKETTHKTHHQNIKYCHNCGAPLRLHHKFCSRCGARI